MTAKEKAKELFKKYSKGKDEHGWALCEFNSCAKICTLIAVDEILKLEQARLIVGSHNYYDYYVEVKQELEKL
jgi:hypothetical protein